MSRLLSNLSLRDRVKETRESVFAAVDVGVGDDPIVVKLLLRRIGFAMILIEEELDEQERGKQR